MDIVSGFWSVVGRAGRNAWEARLGQGDVAKITDETGGDISHSALRTSSALSHTSTRLAESPRQSVLPGISGCPEK
jgi:hypothetical protein